VERDYDGSNQSGVGLLFESFRRGYGHGRVAHMGRWCRSAQGSGPVGTWRCRCGRTTPHTHGHGGLVTRVGLGPFLAAGRSVQVGRPS
jgi:hypothetical protein